VRDVNQALAAKHPSKAAFFQSARLAVNHAFAAPSSPVQQGDEVALIELVGGG
jgi:molybdopterin synthase catalytic subunit